MIHPASNSIVIGPYVIDAARNVRTFESLLSVRVGGMAEHIVNPDTMVYSERLGSAVLLLLLFTLSFPVNSVGHGRSAMGV
jgi:hypothetical protein